ASPSAMAATSSGSQTTATVSSSDSRYLGNITKRSGIAGSDHGHARIFGSYRESLVIGDESIQFLAGRDQRVRGGEVNSIQRPQAGIEIGDSGGTDDVIDLDPIEPSQHACDRTENARATSPECAWHLDLGQLRGDQTRCRSLTQPSVQRR